MLLRLPRKCASVFTRICGLMCFLSWATITGSTSPGNPATSCVKMYPATSRFEGARIIPQTKPNRTIGRLLAGEVQSCGVETRIAQILSTCSRHCLVIMFESCLFVLTLISQEARQTPPGLCTVHAALCEGVHPVLAILARGNFDVWTALSSVPKAVRFASETAHPKEHLQAA